MAKTRQSCTEILQIKDVVRDRDGACVKCGMTNQDHVKTHGRQLDVHRITPGSLYSVEGCESVCKTCHAKLPQRKSGEKDLAWEIISDPKPEPTTWLERLQSSVSANLRAERARRHLTVHQVSEMTGIHYVTIGRYEQGRLPTLEALYSLAEAYGIEPEVLLPPMATVADLPRRRKK